MRFLFLSVILFATACLATPVCAAVRQAPVLSELAPGGSALVAEIRDDLLVLDDGREVGLVGIDLPIAGKGERAWAPRKFTDAARVVLGKLVLQRRVEFLFDLNPRDRHGRWLAQVIVEDGMWLQLELVKRGLARVHGMSDNRKVLPALLAAEARARALRKGIWGKTGYAVRRAEAAGLYLGTFQIFEGRIVDGARAQNQIFLNFGADRDHDLTLRIAGPALALFRAEKVDPLGYVGHLLRVRGWLRPRGRPLIDIAHPDEFEILSH